ncbi:MAG: hypothetical protein ACI8XO_004668 [Verrucomicrobiales bacterium]|jgi:hypothetical protein
MILAAALVFAVSPTHVLLAQGAAEATREAKVDYNQLYKAAVADYNSNRNLEAEAKFRKVLMKYPEHIQTKRYRAILKQRMRAEAAVPIPKRRLHKLVIDEINFRDATLAEVMEYVTAQAKTLSKGEVAPGLVIRGGDAVRDRPLSLNLNSVPIDTLIDATAKLTNTQVVYGQYAITFTPLPTAEELAQKAAKKLDKAEAQARARAASESAQNDPFGNR